MYQPIRQQPLSPLLVQHLLLKVWSSPWHWLSVHMSLSSHHPEALVGPGLLSELQNSFWFASLLLALIPGQHGSGPVSYNDLFPCFWQAEGLAKKARVTACLCEAFCREVAEAGVPRKCSPEISRDFSWPFIFTIKTACARASGPKESACGLRANRLKMITWLEWWENSIQGRWGRPPSRPAGNE